MWTKVAEEDLRKDVVVVVVLMLDPRKQLLLVSEETSGEDTPLFSELIS